jgi:hypothetical protein
MIRETYYLHLQGFVLPSRWRWSNSFRTLVDIHQITWHNTLKDSNLQSPMSQPPISQYQDTFQHDRLINPIIWRKYCLWVLGLKVQFQKQYSKPSKHQYIYKEYRTPCTFTVGEHHLEWRTRFHLAGKSPSTSRCNNIENRTEFSLHWKPKMSYTSNLITYSKS